MTHLRKMMLEELERRNYTENTTRAYIRTIEDFARYFKRPPDQLGPEQIRTYVAHLFRDRKLTDNTVNQRVGALITAFGEVGRIATTKSASIRGPPVPTDRRARSVERPFRLPRRRPCRRSSGNAGRNTGMAGETPTPRRVG